VVNDSTRRRVVLARFSGDPGRALVEFSRFFARFFALAGPRVFTRFMSVEVERAAMPCGTCGAQVVELRRGRCWGCYQRWVEARPVGRGATCTVCFEKRRDQLKLVELHGRTMPLCHGCGARIARMDDVPATIDGLREALRRDRRTAEKRTGKIDHRIFPRERRVGDRRGPPRDGAPEGDPSRENTMLAEMMEEIIVELHEADMEEVEQTKVRDRDQATATPEAPPTS
jgi:hypothetical protein